MTAPLNLNNKYLNEGNFITDFMQTVQLNCDLDRNLMILADVHQRDESGFTALYWAISHNNMHNVKTLLAYGSTMEVSPTLNAPFCAIACDRIEMLKFFLDKGIDINIRRRDKTLLEFAKGLQRIEIISYLKIIIL